MYWFIVFTFMVQQVSAGYDATDIEKMTFPNFPEDYVFSSDGEREGYECLSTYIGKEDSEDNFLCIKLGETVANPLIHWFSTGMTMTGMKCISITEPNDKDYDQKATLCLPEVIPLNLQWSNNGAIKNAKCLRFNDRSSEAWSNNYLCTEPEIEQKYPLWPVDFQWSYAGKLSGYDCLAIREPSEPAHLHWNDNFFCVRSGEEYKKVDMKWSYQGPINNMRCVLIKEPSDSHNWHDNYLCVPYETPYHFQWSHTGAIANQKCLAWFEPSDPQTWKDNFLCGMGSPAIYPSWPEDFKFSYAGTLTGYKCLAIREPSEPSSHAWEDNYMCVKSGNGFLDVGMQWSYNGQLNGMRCVNIKEPWDKHDWHDNYLCVPENTPYHFQWSHGGPINGKQCIQWREPSDPDTWSDNYLCHERTGYPKWPKDFLFSYNWWVNGYVCVQITEPSEPDAHGWSNNYFCYKKQQKMMDPKIKWSNAGKLPGMKCTQVYEPSDPHTWNDNFLCVPLNSPYNFVWSHGGYRGGLSCQSWNEPGDKHTWSDNYMCHQST